MKRLTIALCALTLAGCVAMAKVETGDRAIGDRLAVKLDGAWNHLEAPGLGPAQTWTMEGLPIDQLLLYSGIKDGELVHAGGAGGKQKDFAFRSNMQAHEIVAMFEGMLTRDGSSFRLVKLEPSSFGGLKGFRFDYVLTRKVDNVVLSGVGYGGVSKGELFAILYMAPRLGFFARHAPRVERIVQSARVKE
ncbi:MAG: hypothetical protein A3G24_25245 [Betaproteobacteria bacterium RIFCSPLOWO2_12_FULL_62_13]|nr:MAG: hypothetical protein A3G24_25245 [Betaproteobacteria bacterium RIFCSPLOWO2_12_FULL_62_13]